MMHDREYVVVSDGKARPASHRPTIIGVSPP
jgi:hypothetical protein